MRTTIDLPPAAHRRVRELAALRGVSLSAVVAELTVRGLAQVDAPLTLPRSPRPDVMPIGRPRCRYA